MTLPKLRGTLRRAARVGIWCHVLVLAFVLEAAPAAAQTISSGAIHGVVLGSERQPLENVRVVVQERQTGLAHVLRTDADGRFALRLLSPGSYDVLAEKLGYRPSTLVDIPLRATRVVDVEVELASAEPPVMSIDTVRFDDEWIGWSRPGLSRSLTQLEIDAPRILGYERALLGFSSAAVGDASFEGLPTTLSRVVVENVAGRRLLGGGPITDPIGFWPVSRLDNAELVSGLPDVEYAGAAGAQLFTAARRGSRDFNARAWGGGSDAQLPLGLFSDDIATTLEIGRAGVEVGGPVIADTAVFLLGAEWRRTSNAVPRAFRIDELEGARVEAAARDRADVGLLGVSFPRLEERDALAAWGRFDWLIADGHAVSSFIDFAYTTAAEPVSPAIATPAATGNRSSLDLVAGAVVRSRLTGRLSNELRVSVDHASADEELPGGEELRGFGSTGIPTTRIISADLLFGAAPTSPAAWTRSSIAGEQALLFAAGRHLVKAGLAVEWATNETTAAFARAGSFVFGDAASFEAGNGSFLQTVGLTPTASWSALELGVFAQDRWEPTAGLELSLGIRYMQERLPEFGATDPRWTELTGIESDASSRQISEFAPRAGLSWNVRQQNRWIVQAGIGSFHDDVDATLIAERSNFDGGVDVRRGLGALGAWPALPDADAAPETGPILTLLGPDFRSPRSTRASFGISRLGAASVHLAAVYRHTDFLPARRDLNLLPVPAAHDQYGRPIFGELRQAGALVAAAPGSNRRFAEFDVVSALEATAFSDYWDASVLIERRASRNIRLAAAYTFSRTRDNWLARPGVLAADATEPQFADTATSTGWAEGVSDFDVPHRLSVVAEWTVDVPFQPTLGAVYRVRSGLPFTPTFQPGVDVNADYGSNDPAYIDPDVEGMDALLEAWDCLRDGTNDFAVRNSCRGDVAHSLDLRLGFTVDAFGGSARLFVDAIDVLETELALPDAALYHVDSNASLTQDDATRTVTIPLLVNSGFGEPVRALRGARIIRFGAEVAF